MSLINSHLWKEGSEEETKRYLLYVGMHYAAQPGVSDIIASSDYPDTWDALLPSEKVSEGFLHDDYNWWKIVDKTTMQVIREADFVNNDFVRILREVEIIDATSLHEVKKVTRWEPPCVEGVVEVKRVASLNPENVDITYNRSTERLAATVIIPLSPRLGKSTEVGSVVPITPTLEEAQRDLAKEKDNPS